MYVLIVLVSFIIGVITTFLFKKICEKTSEFLKTHIIISSVIALIYSITATSLFIVNKLTEKLRAFGDLANPGKSFSLVELFNTTQLINVNVSFIVTIIFFNLPALFLFF